MNKVTLPMGNDFCPQTLFMYGTFKEDGTPNFGLFCWFSYFWDGGLGVMAAIGGPKLTLDRIQKTKVFSANLVTESTLALADHFGTIEGYTAEKMTVDAAWQKGAVLDVPILSASPIAFELALDQTIERDGSTVMLCHVKHVLGDAILLDDQTSLTEKMQYVSPVRTTCSTYFGWDGRLIAGWHTLANAMKNDSKK